MTSTNLFSLFEQIASSHADRVLLRDAEGRAWSYADMLAESARVANLLTGLGLVPGDRVSVQVEKSVNNLWLYLGALRAGLVYHPLNTAYTLEEMRYFLGDAEPGLLVCQPARMGDFEPLCDALGVPRLMTLGDAQEGTLAAALQGQSDHFETVDRTPEHLAALLYSSGTTGKPKGIMLSHGNLMSNAEVLVDLWGFSEDDTLLHALPVYHVHGLFVAVHCVLGSGASMTWLNRFDVAEVLEALPSATVMMGVPTFYTRLLADDGFAREHCRSMRVFISGSAPLQEQTFDAFEARTGHRILERYGMSETGMNSSNPLLGERVPGTVGPPLPGTDIRVVDAQRKPLPVDEIGDIEVRGDNVFKGYWRMPEKTAADLDRAGWFRTGDQGSFDRRGYLSIVGRSKDMVITGGLNVYPKEVERVLDQLPGVSESAVFGVPHPDFGEAVVGAVVARPGHTLDESVLRDALSTQLAGFKVPKRIQCLAALPRNSMSKVQKTQLREQWPWPF